MEKIQNKNEKSVGNAIDITNTLRKSTDVYEQYYLGNGFGQQTHAKSMNVLSRFFKNNGVSSVLDFYCGTGRNSFFLSKEGFDVHGFDRSKFALDIATQKQKENKTDVKFNLFELEGKLPYENSSFDAVIIVRALYQAKMDTIRKNVEEISRVTKSGGYVYMESIQHFKDWNSEEHRARVLETEEKGTYQYKDNGSYYHMFTKPEIKELFSDFKTIRFYFRNGHFYVLFQKP